jgi:hypothetical protein
LDAEERGKGGIDATQFLHRQTESDRTQHWAPMAPHHAADDPDSGEVRKQLLLKLGPFPGRSRNRAQVLLGEGPDTGTNRALVVSQERIRQVVVD